MLGDGQESEASSRCSAAFQGSGGDDRVCCRPIEGDPDRARAAAEQSSDWFVRTRWVAVVVSMVLVLLGMWSSSVVIVAGAWPLLVIVSLLAAANTIYPRIAASDRYWSVNLRAQVFVDLLLLVAMLHYSGGVENPLSVLLVLHVIIGGVLLGRIWCLTTAVVASVLYAGLVWAEWLRWIAHYPLLVGSSASQAGPGLQEQTVYVAAQTVLHTTMLLLVAVFVGTLGERARSSQARQQSLAEAAIAHHRLLGQAIETTNTAMRVVDDDLRPILVNARWQAWTRGGRSGDQDGVGVKLDHDADMTMRDGQTRVSQLEIPDESGRSGLTLRLTTASIDSRDGGIKQVVQLAQDISELSRHHDEMVRASQLAAVGELAGQVAHEVNNPIAIINAKARLLISDHRDELSERTGSELAKIIDLSDRVARIAQGLLSSCRPSPGTRSLEELEPLVVRAISLVEAHAGSNGVRIETCFSDPPAFSVVNPGQFEQVVLNILLNALDAMPDGGSMRVRCERDGGSLRDGAGAVAFIVEDTGPGIDPELRERVFDLFFSTKRDGRGTGLGLSICRGIVRSFSGDIEIDRAPIGGARITVRLPRMMVDGEESHA